MKSLLWTAAVAATLVTTQAFADAAADAAKAAAAYAKREYSNSGSASAQEAADLYAKAAAGASGAEKAKYLVGVSKSLYFVGDQASQKNVKLEKFLKGRDAGDQAVKLLGLADVASVTDAQLGKLKSLPKDQLTLLGEALYQRGANLGQWGQTYGFPQNLTKWPELRRNMEAVDVLGVASVQSYGSYRILGRAFQKVPAGFGGDIDKAVELLKKAVQNTLHSSKKFSKNGFNNTFYAEVLKEKGNTAAAKALLQAFIAADAASIDPDSIPELKKAQFDAKELLKSL